MEVPQLARTGASAGGSRRHEPRSERRASWPKLDPRCPKCVSFWKRMDIEYPQFSCLLLFFLFRPKMKYKAKEVFLDLVVVLY